MKLSVYIVLTFSRNEMIGGGGGGGREKGGGGKGGGGGGWLSRNGELPY